MFNSTVNALFGTVRQGTPIQGSTILITGAASGIGLEMALEAATRKARHVLIWDLNEAAAQKAVAQIENVPGPTRASYWCVDVTSTASVEEATQEVLSEFGHVDILINNAGVVSGKEFLDLDEQDVQRTFEVNTISLYRVTRRFLPGMLERDRGSIVTIASAAGLVGVAKQTDYSASKFAALGFAESLRAELRHSGSNIHTLVYCPYYISTGMFDGVKTKYPFLLPILEPNDVALNILDCIETGRQMKVQPMFVKLAQLGKFLPVPLIDGILDVLGINQTMENFVGRTGINSKIHMLADDKADLSAGILKP